MSKLLIVFILMLSCDFCFAQKVDSSQHKQRREKLQSIERGRIIKVNGQQYQHLPKVLAVQKKQSNKTDGQLLAEVGSNENDRLENKGNFVIYKHSVGRGKASVSSVGANDTYSTVINTRTNHIGLLLGTIMVHPKNMDDANAIAASAGVDLVKSYPHLNLVICKAKKDTDVLDAVTVLSADKRVKDAYPEILENVQVPH